jgi:hypothetical protein
MHYCVTGRHAWLDPASAERCCSGRFDRVLVKPEDVPSTALPDGRVHHAALPMLFVWVPRYNSQEH